MKLGVPVSGRLTLPLLWVHRSKQLQCCLPLPYSGCKKFQLDTLKDVICTCPAHSGAKKAHDRAVTQLAYLFRTTTKVTSTHVSCSRGKRCEDIELTAFLENAAGAINLVMDILASRVNVGGLALLFLTAPSIIPCLMK